MFSAEVFLKSYIEERVLESADYIIKNNATIRQCAKQFGRLLQIYPSKAQKVRKVLDKNKSERHIRGGMATREKYKRPQVKLEAVEFGGPSGNFTH